MKVALLHNLPVGGASRQASEWNRELESAGWETREVRLAGSDQLTDQGHVVACFNSAREARRALRVPAHYIALAALINAWRRAVNDAEAWGAELLFVQGCKVLETPIATSFASVPSVYFAAAGPRRRTYGPPENPVLQLPESLPRRYVPLELAAHTIDAHAYRSATSVLTNSAYTAAWLQGAYGGVAPQVVAGGVSEAFLNSAPSPDGRGDHLLAVGTLLPHKGFDLAIKVAARVDRPLWIAGPSPSAEYARSLESLARDIGCDLTLLGALADTDLAKEYRRAHLFIHVAEHEPLGLVSYEAQACACPVIVSRSGGLPETVTDGVSGFVVERDEQALALAVQRLDDTDTHKRVSDSAEPIGGSMTWAASAKDLMSHLAETASTKRR